ncbi:MAG: hypothetical protein HZB43_10135 [candidate division Zixibacteria bacterium]|nr:hypothetical protein [candidate division Zixibacteria bacterium]
MKSPSYARRFPDQNWLWGIGLFIATVLFLYQVRDLWFTQDDAFISYRYAANALRGDGLVFNAGEKVEGYTNFLWVILLMLGGSLNLAFNTVAKLLGIASGMGLIILSGSWVRIAWRKLEWGDGTAPGVAAALLLAGNSSVAYWSVSGLETSWFAIWAGLGVWWWVRRSWLTIAALTIACLSRPEGALIWGLLVVAEWIWGDGLPRALRLAAGAVLLVPYAIFKIWYYGSLLPNPFYAKTGLGFEYFASGLDYTMLYLNQYGLFGVLALLVLISLWVLPRRWRTVPAIWILYTIYIVLVGGDVLKAHRFFVPTTALMAVATMVSVGWLTRRFAPTTLSVWLASGIGLGLSAWTLLWPLDSILRIRGKELDLVGNMGDISADLLSTDQTNFSLATSTIGKISFELLGHRVIDMLGLTDSTIARHPESVPGLTSTWRERNFNATYVLRQNPDYILFSTGLKPSAPAERALVLHKKYRRNYYTVMYPPRVAGGTMQVLSRRKGVFQGLDEVWPSSQLASDIHDAISLLITDKSRESYDLLSRLRQEGPGDFPFPDMILAEILRSQGAKELALQYADEAIAIDSFAVMAWWEKAVIYHAQQDTVRLEATEAQLRKLAPWLLGSY